MINLKRFLEKYKKINLMCIYIYIHTHTDIHSNYICNVYIKMININKELINTDNLMLPVNILRISFLQNSKILLLTITIFLDFVRKILQHIKSLHF